MSLTINFFFSSDPNISSIFVYEFDIILIFINNRNRRGFPSVRMKRIKLVLVACKECRKSKYT